MGMRLDTVTVVTMGWQGTENYLDTIIAGPVTGVHQLVVASVMDSLLSDT